VPYCRTGNLLFHRRPLPLKDGKLPQADCVVATSNTAAGKEGAKFCAINILAQAKARSATRKNNPPGQDHRLRRFHAGFSSSSTWSPTALPISWWRCWASAASMPLGRRHRLAAAHAAVEIEAIFEVE